MIERCPGIDDREFSQLIVRPNIRTSHQDGAFSNLRGVGYRGCWMRDHWISDISCHFYVVIDLAPPPIVTNRQDDIPKLHSFADVITIGEFCQGLDNFA